MTAQPGTRTRDHQARPRPDGPSRPAKGRIRRHQERAILEAAEQVFARAGFQGATMAEIALKAGLPKSNLHYYFGTKGEVYRAVLENILALWLAQTDPIRPEADPREAIGGYVRAKMRLSAARPDASRVFANEVIHDAPHLKDYLCQDLKALVEEKAAVLEGWMEQGRMARVDPVHLFFTIWAMTQTYADFESQVCAVLGRPRLTGADYQRATDHVVTMILRHCGLEEQRR